MKLDPKTTAFLFPGQGSQAVGMGKALAEEYADAKQLFDEADSILGFTLSNLMWNDAADAQAALELGTIETPHQLAPRLPVQGIPGWDAANSSATYYANPSVFRPTGRAA